MTPESVAIVFLFFHFDRIFADLNSPFFFQEGRFLKTSLSKQSVKAYSLITGRLR